MICCPGFRAFSGDEGLDWRLDLVSIYLPPVAWLSILRDLFNPNYCSSCVNTLSSIIFNASVVFSRSRAKLRSPIIFGDVITSKKLFGSSVRACQSRDAMQ
jgi:hypothetical protein